MDIRSAQLLTGLAVLSILISFLGVQLNFEALNNACTCVVNNLAYSWIGYALSSFIGLWIQIQNKPTGSEQPRKNLKWFLTIQMLLFIVSMCFMIYSGLRLMKAIE